MTTPTKVILPIRNDRDKRTPQQRTRWQVKFHKRGIGEEGGTTRRFKTKQEAEEWIADRLAQIKLGEPIAKKAHAGHTVAVAIDEYLEAHSVAKGQLGGYKGVQEMLGEVAIARLETVPKKQKNGRALNSVQIWLEQLATKEVAPKGPKGKPSGKLLAASTRRKYFFALKKSVLWYAKKHSLRISTDCFAAPPDGLPQAWSNTSKRDRRPTQDEIKRLLKHAGAGGLGVPAAVWQRLILFALQTAMRVQEIIRAEWADLQHNGTALDIHPENVKTRTERTVPLTPYAREIVAEQRKTLDKDKPQARIFWQIKQPHDVSEAFTAIRDEAGIQDLNFHDLRHEAISQLVQTALNLSLVECMKITGHTSLTTFERYVKLRPDELTRKVNDVPGGSFGPRYKLT